MGITTTTIPLNAEHLKAEIINEVKNDVNLLGEIRSFAISVTGASTKADLQAKGWAICDGTTPAAQGISDADITATPDLKEKFLRHSENETTGGTGGSATHNHKWHNAPSWSYNNQKRITCATISGSDVMTSYDSDGDTLNITTNNLSRNYYTTKIDGQPPYYDICYFMKVKV